MPIPSNIQRDHIIEAVWKIEAKGIPARRGIQKWAVLYEGSVYPCKLLISWANIFANHEELDPHPRNFTTYSAKKYLADKHFQIISYPPNNL